MATKEEVLKLAALARIRITEDELEKFTQDFEAIVKYVSQLEDVPIGTDDVQRVPTLRNVMRPDQEPHASGAYTDALVDQFPAKEGNALLVKQIISHD
jgi:aspartyl-tRNA(Asn)/glutamyl-tRNA(Gln) amidotransferase subunit C